MRPVHAVAVAQAHPASLAHAVGQARAREEIRVPVLVRHRIFYINRRSRVLHSEPHLRIDGPERALKSSVARVDVLPKVERVCLFGSVCELSLCRIEVERLELLVEDAGRSLDARLKGPRPHRARVVELGGGLLLFIVLGFPLARGGGELDLFARSLFAVGQLVAHIGGELVLLFPKLVRRREPLVEAEVVVCPLDLAGVGGCFLSALCRCALRPIVAMNAGRRREGKRRCLRDRVVNFGVRAVAPVRVLRRGRAVHQQELGRICAAATKKFRELSSGVPVAVRPVERPRILIVAEMARSAVAGIGAGRE